MKIRGKKLDRKNQRTVTFYRWCETDAETNGETPYDEIKLVITSLPPGFYDSLLAYGLRDYPSPPKEAPRDKDGKVIVNPETRQVDFTENYNDPDYRRKLTNAQRRVDAVLFREYLRNNADVEFETKAPEKADKKLWEKYAEALAGEIRDAGFTDGEIREVLATGIKTECVTSLKDVEDFLSRHRSEAEKKASFELPTGDGRGTRFDTSSTD